MWLCVQVGVVVRVVEEILKLFLRNPKCDPIPHCP